MSDRLIRVNPSQIEAIEKKLKELQMLGIDEGVIKDFVSTAYEKKMWENIVEEPTPPEMVKTRKGAWSKEKNDYVELEYFPEELTLKGLNEDFPGWWTEDMKYSFHSDLRVMVVEGYLCVEYPTVKGMKVTKRWAVAGSRIEYTQDVNKVTGLHDASQPDDVVKSARTEWLKVAGKWYGYGLDIYTQKITPALWSMFEERIATWKHTEGLIAIAQTFTGGKGFRDFLKRLPTFSQGERLKAALELIPPDVKNGDLLVHDWAWEQFVKLRNDSDENRRVGETFITKLEQFALTNYKQ
jgi:hypothetical protein